MSSNSKHSIAAYLEDCDENDHTPIPGTRQTANIAAKRSKPDIGQLKIPTKGRDEASDSGYSSQTAPTVASVESLSHGSKKGQSQPKPDLVRTSSKRMQPNPERPQSGQRSPEKGQRSPEKGGPIHKSVLRTQKRENLRLDTCESREDAARMRTTATPVDAPRSATPRSAAPNFSRPGAGRGPPSPQATRTPAATTTTTQATTFPIPRPALMRPRASSSQDYHAQRPSSYHAGQLEPIYMPQTPLFYEAPTHTLVDGSYFVQYPPQSGSYTSSVLPNSSQRQVDYPFAPTQFPALYQPQSQQWPQESSYRSQGRRASWQNHPPLVDYPSVPSQGYTTLFTQQQPVSLTRHLSIHRTEHPSTLPPSDEGLYAGDHFEEYYINRQTQKSVHQSQPRPTKRPLLPTKSSSASVHFRRTEQDARDSMEKPHDTSPRKPSFESRKQSLEEARPASRPSLVTRTTIASNAGSGKPSTVVSGGNDANPPLRHRNRPVSYYGQTRQDLVRQAEAYQTSKSGPSDSLTADTVKQAIKRQTKTNPSGPSETGSRASRASSSHDGNETKHPKPISRTSMDKHRGGAEIRIRKDESMDENFKMRFQTNQGVTLDLEGRTISVRPSRDGAMTISVGTATVKNREGRQRESSTRRYSYVGEGKAVREIDDKEYHSKRGRSRSIVVREREEKEKERQKGEVVVEERGLVERFKMRMGSRSRRDSSSRPKNVPVEGQFF